MANNPVNSRLLEVCEILKIYSDYFSYKIKLKTTNQFIV